MISVYFICGEGQRIVGVSFYWLYLIAFEAS